MARTHIDLMEPWKTCLGPTPLWRPSAPPPASASGLRDEGQLAEWTVVDGLEASTARQSLSCRLPIAVRVSPVRRISRRRERSPRAARCICPAASGSFRSAAPSSIADIPSSRPVDRYHLFWTLRPRRIACGTTDTATISIKAVALLESHRMPHCTDTDILQRRPAPAPASGCRRPASRQSPGFPAAGRALRSPAPQHA